MGMIAGCGRVWLQSALLGGVVMFVVFMSSWMVLPWHMQSLNRFTDEAAMAKALLAGAPTHGVYALPGMPDANGKPSAIQRPNAFVMVNPAGYVCSPEAMTRHMALELLNCLLGAALLAKLLLMAGALTFAQRVQFSAVVGALVALASEVPNWNWWNFPLAFLWPNALDSLIATTLAGVVIAWWLGRAEQRAAAVG